MDITIKLCDTCLIEYKGTYQLFSGWAKLQTADGAQHDVCNTCSTLLTTAHIDQVLRKASDGES